MNVAFIASEAVPYAKTGGLADVVGALPRALVRWGHGATIIMPYYPRLPGAPRETSVVAEFPVPVGERHFHASVRQPPEHEGVRYLLVDNPEFFHRSRLYVGDDKTDFPDNCERFTFFCRAALETIVKLRVPADCLHLHDWQTGLIPAYCRTLYREAAPLGQAATVFTIHNLAYQGLFPAEKWPLTGLDPRFFGIEGFEFHGKFSLLKGGINFSDVVSTVSRTYAREIQEEESGCGLDGVMRGRAEFLRGIVNGIDYSLWDPACDSVLPCHYDVSDWREGKANCKQHLRALMGLPERGETPLLASVGRLTSQKGYQLLLDIAEELVADGVQMAILGEGDPDIENGFRGLARRFPEQVAVSIAFDEELSHHVYAGADMFLMPSQFEPCGLAQLYSLRYGTVPVVRGVGGLKDTVVDRCPSHDGCATGFQFYRFTAHALYSAIRRALAAYQRPAVWTDLVGRGMAQNWSWETSAQHYVALYEKALETARRPEKVGACA